MKIQSLRGAILSFFVGLGFVQAPTSFSQSTFALQNKNAFSGIDAPVFDSLGMPLVGANYRAELWGGMSADSLIPAADIEYQQPRLIIPFGNSGYFNTSRIATILSIVPPGGAAWLQVRAWDARLGGLYENVAALGLGGYGESPLFFLTAGGNPTTPTLPVPLTGLQSFSLRPIVPEPSGASLLLFGGAVRWWMRKKWRS